MNAITSAFAPEFSDGQIEYANLTETGDAPADISTPYSMTVDDTFFGDVAFLGDDDWVAIQFVAGQSYIINMGGTGAGTGTMPDGALTLYDSSGNQLAYADLGGPSYDALISFTATYSGTYYLSAAAYNDSYTGTYTLSVDVAELLPVATLDELAAQLTHGYWEDTNRSWHAFDTSGSNQITVNISKLTAEGQQLALWSFEAWEMVADIDFVVTTGTAQIDFDDEDAGAYASFTASGNETISAFVNVGTGWLSTYNTTIGSYSLQTYIHEIGHALGLGHQGTYNGIGGYGTTVGSDNKFLNDSWQFSVMSYFDQNENTYLTADKGYLIGGMMADVLAVQNLYGAPGASSATAGNTTWGANTNLTGMLGYAMMAAFNGGPSGNMSTNNIAYNIYDQGGTDTIDLSTVLDANTVNMNGGTVSDIAGFIGNMTISQGTVIENLILGSGNDYVTGNVVSNNIDLGAGDDYVWANDGWDTVFGGAGMDTIYGGNGNDRLWAGSGDDGAYGNNGDDWIGGGLGNDTLGGGGGNDVLWGQDGNDQLFGADGDDTIYGDQGSDLVYGGSGNDVVDGGTENDTMWGGAGKDTIYGGSGDDLFGGSKGNDVLYGEAGNDTVYGGTGNDVVGGGADDDDLGGNKGNDVMWGGNGHDTLAGGAGNDTLDGGVGNDRIDGGAGNDVATGGIGADTFVFAGSNIGSSNIVTDFAIAEGDRLELDNALWGNAALSAAQVVATYGSVWQGNTFFVFDSNNIFLLEGVGTLTGLENVIDIV